MRSKTTVSSAGKTDAPAGTAGTEPTLRLSDEGWGMSALLATPCIVATARAVAEAELPRARPKPIVGFAFYRKRTVAQLRRYAQLSMELGRPQSALGKMALRGHASSYRLKTFEDGLVFVLDIEKCLNLLDRTSRKIVTHIALEDYTIVEAVSLMGRSPRSIARIYGEAMDRLTDLFLKIGVLEANVENLSRVEAKVESNEAT